MRLKQHENLQNKKFHCSNFQAQKSSESKFGQMGSLSGQVKFLIFFY